MALIKCIECGKEFSEFAKECPQCGMPTKLLMAKNETHTKDEEHSDGIFETIFLICVAIFYSAIGCIPLAFIFASLAVDEDEYSKYFWTSYFCLLVIFSLITYFVGKYSKYYPTSFNISSSGKRKKTSWRIRKYDPSSWKAPQKRGKLFY